MSPNKSALAAVGELPAINTADAIKQMATAVINTERQAVTELLQRIDDEFVRACQLMLQCEGRLVVVGMGKSGHIGSKLAATLASTGSPAFFVHPGEASHGDLGMITQQDVVIALSNSGETQEVLTILPVIKRLGINLIALTGKPKSTLATNATVHLDVSVAEEACPLGLAPTASTTAALVMGDALAISLLQARGFTAEDFARSHPGGALGRRLLVHIADVMHSGDEIPKVRPTDAVATAIVEITQKGLGLTAVVNDSNRLLGVFTDGDLRRLIDTDIDIKTTAVEQVMTRDCKTIGQDELAVEAAHLMEGFKIHSLLVVDQHDHLQGALNIHDLLRAGVV